MSNVVQRVARVVFLECFGNFEMPTSRVAPSPASCNRIEMDSQTEYYIFYRARCSITTPTIRVI